MQRHEFDVVAFVAGLLAVAGAVLYQLGADVDARWALSFGLIAVGLAGIATALRSGAEHPDDAAE